MTTEAFDRFQRSMAIDYAKWHDGVGYALEEVPHLPADERELAEQLVLSRGAADWRDVEALDAFGSPRALAAMQQALASADLTVKLEAATRLRRRGLLSDDAIDDILIQALDHATLRNGLTQLLQMVGQHPSPAVKRKLLACTLTGHDDLRAHAAALLHFLHGKSQSEFDVAHRPFYLRFNSASMAERQRAYQTLCADIGICP
ncbi:hypothetical protein [Aquabacterium sp.]|uniref:hypothetical protein n=1 Tax=Aquabacterium sp. TaxID=1872578 RepID=UPI003BAFE20E